MTAAGNEGEDACNYAPGCSEYTITVGAYNSLHERSSFSNYGMLHDITRCHLCKYRKLPFPFICYLWTSPSYTKWINDIQYTDGVMANKS